MSCDNIGTTGLCDHENHNVPCNNIGHWDCSALKSHSPCKQVTASWLVLRPSNVLCLPQRLSIFPAIQSFVQVLCQVVPTLCIDDGNHFFWAILVSALLLFLCVIKAHGLCGQSICVTTQMPFRKVFKPSRYFGIYDTYQWYSQVCAVLLCRHLARTLSCSSQRMHSPKKTGYASDPSAKFWSRKVIPATM